MNILVQNLKPTIFLLKEHAKVFLGDIGIPYHRLGVERSKSNLELSLGTPNYIALEQWEPKVRGPITLVINQEKSQLLGGLPTAIENVPNGRFEYDLLLGGLPTAIENVPNGRFEYDLCNRPLMVYIFQEFERLLTLPPSLLLLS
ncbi:hypothetical protein HAX54_033885 [Datura stramonium]|uniref:Uncharacterized protein n=1 Tax=Datura stramonium TaxID=4076 RepID=A0ABS8VD19_DATST|nr:hypothetical protein [Datura stramonium]